MCVYFLSLILIVCTSIDLLGKEVVNIYKRNNDSEIADYDFKTVKKFMYDFIDNSSYSFDLWIPVLSFKKLKLYENKKYRKVVKVIFRFLPYKGSKQYNYILNFKNCPRHPNNHRAFEWFGGKVNSKDSLFKGITKELKQEDKTLSLYRAFISAKKSPSRRNVKMFYYHQRDKKHKSYKISVILRIDLQTKEAQKLLSKQMISNESVAFFAVSSSQIARFIYNGNVLSKSTYNSIDYAFNHYN